VAPQAEHWIIFGIVITAGLAVDLAIFHRKSKKVSLRGAVLESAAWILLSLGFNLWVYFALGSRPAVEFLTAYVVEKSLSVDNIFVFILIFRAFLVPDEAQHKVLFYGVIGALVLRALFVLAGVELLEAVHAIVYVFGAFLLFTGVRMMLSGERVVHPDQNWLVRIALRVFPVRTDGEGQQFFVTQDNRWNATPLFLALLAVEAMDVIFAVDSVPAVLAISRDTFIVYSSNAFAILGLRALYFALADILPRFRFLHQGLALIIIFVGGKMLAADWIKVSTEVSLGIIAVILIATVLLSLAFPQRRAAGA
jgi:tellurite resistance protein TerC